MCRCAWPRPSGPAVGEAGRHHHQAVHPLGPAGLDHLGDRRGRHRDHRQVDRVRDVGRPTGTPGRPAPTRASGFTGYTGPVKSPRSRFTSTACPSLAGSADAPITAIDRGDEQPGDRPGLGPVLPGRHAPPGTCSVGAMSKTRSTTPESYSRLTEYPASMNTRTSGCSRRSTSAVNRRMPRSWAAAARCSSRIEPSPRPCWESSTRNATSAASGSPAELAVVGPGRDDLAAQHRDQPDRCVVVDVGERPRSARRRPA